MGCVPLRVALGKCARHLAMGRCVHEHGTGQCIDRGIVGNGDKIGAENKDNLLRAVRLDGAIVKPDTPLLPIDAMYASDASAMLAADGSSAPQPMIASAHTDHGALRTAYVVAYSRGAEDAKAAFTPAQAGIRHDAYLYDARARTARRL